MHNTRRTFLMAVAATGAALNHSAHAQAMVDEKDPQAAALGYVADATKTDTKKQSRYVAGQSCSSCLLYQGKVGNDAGVCPIFSGKKVSAEGWCSAWTKKA